VREVTSRRKVTAYVTQLPELYACLPLSLELGGLSAGEGSLSSWGNITVLILASFYLLACLFYARWENFTTGWAMKIIAL